MIPRDWLCLAVEVDDQLLWKSSCREQQGYRPPYLVRVVWSMRYMLRKHCNNDEP